MKLIWLSSSGGGPVSPTIPGGGFEEPPTPVNPDDGTDNVTPTTPGVLFPDPPVPVPPDTGPEQPGVAPTGPSDFSPPPEPFPGGPA